LRQSLPREILHETAQLLRGEQDTFNAVVERAALQVVMQPAAVSLLVEIDPAWKPQFRVRNLTQAQLSGAAWPNVSLTAAALHRTNFAGADLLDANLRGVRALQANFS